MIRPLYKVHEPFMDVVSGFGHLGVVMYDDTNDSVQCHICGGWVKMLAQHARMAHGIKSEQYRQQFSLPLRSGLMAKSTSAKFSKRSMTPKNMEQLRKMRLKSKSTPASVSKGISSRRTRRCFAAKNRLSFKNKNGLCPAQMMARYQVVAKIVGGLPSNHDLLIYDKGMYNAARRFGSVDEWRKANNLEIFPKTKQKMFGDIGIIAALRKFSYQNKRTPSVADWKRNGEKPSVPTIQRVFGSWSQALVTAGLAA